MTAYHPKRSEGSHNVAEPDQIPRRSAPRSDPQQPRPTRALVTGGGGFLGQAIVERLLGRGCQVRSFARAEYPELAELGVKVLRGDLTNADALDAACRNCAVVFHTAARAGVWGKYDDYYEPNVRGTENVIAACRSNGVSRLVFTSSPSVVFDGTDMEGVDESAPYPTRHHSHYSATKAIAEQLVLAASDANLRTLALRPHLIWGPGDNHIVPQLVARAKAGRLRQVGDGTNKVDSTYIDNVAEAHVLAADALETNPNAAGQAYFISNGEPRPVWALINRILAAAGLPPVTRRISRRTARMIGGVLECAYALFCIESEPRMTRFLADELATSHWFDISAARRELGYEPRVSIDEGLRRLEQWFQESGSLSNE